MVVNVTIIVEKDGKKAERSFILEEENDKKERLMWGGVIVANFWKLLKEIEGR